MGTIGIEQSILQAKQIQIMTYYPLTKRVKRDIKFLGCVSFDFSESGFFYDRFVRSLLDYIYSLDYNGINRVAKLPDIS